ncbi:MAG: SdrD B-like domain-containing protein, partial [Methanoregulaceae archaeon]
GTYTLSETLKPGYQAGTSPGTVTLACNQDLTNQNFINTKLLCISGYKLDGCSGAGLPDWTITLKDSSGATIATTITNANGYYQFCNLVPGTYTLSETLKAGYQAGAAPGTVTLTTESAQNRNFTNTKLLCISGYKLDGSSSTGLPGWTITLKDSSGATIGTAVTDEEGFYQFCNLVPGTYTLSETVQPGYHPGTSPGTVTLACNQDLPNQNFINTKLLCISGYKRDACNDAGLPDWTITLKDSSGATVGTTTTNANGFYQFCNLLPGTYTLAETLKPGYKALSSPGTVTLGSNQNLTNQNFINTKLLCISGYKLDAATSTGLPDWTITLKDSSGTTVGTTTTGATGSYQFCDLVPGQYTLTETLKPGYQASSSPGTVTLACNQNLTGQNFINTKLYCISGYKMDACSDAGLPGWTINLQDSSGATIRTTTTGATGSYQFCNLAPGTYTLTETLKPGYMAVSSPGTVTLGNQDLTGQNFINTRLLCISGYKMDIASNTGLAGWTITLRDSSGATVRTTTTGANGSYQFCNLAPGTYTLTETVVTGWTQVFAPGPVTLTCEDATHQDFFNARLLCISGYKLDAASNTGLPGWTITLRDSSGATIGTTTTDDKGFYQFCNLAPGTYTLAETLKDTWEAVSAPGPVTLVNDDALNQNFKNTLLISCLQVDIKPGMCPNPFNPNTHGLLQVAILGTAHFNVDAVNPASVTLNGVSPESWSYKDVGTPYPANSDDYCLTCETCDSCLWCGCHALGGDGHVDLLLMFDNRKVAASLMKYANGDFIPVWLTGQVNGKTITGYDCLWITL